MAIYAAYQQMIQEVTRYKKCNLKELESHTSADTRSDSVGDIQVVNEEGLIFEAVEIKHGIEITSDMIEKSYKKFHSTSINRYYLLTTYEPNQPNEQISNTIIKINKSHGCQVIVNGIIETLKYYLRLLENTNDFINNYSKLMNNDSAIMFEHKEAWNKIIEES